MIIVWNTVGLAIAFVLRSHLDLIDIALGITIGLWGHILIDILFHEPVYTVPSTLSIPKILCVSPLGNEFQPIHGGGLAVSAPWSIYQKLAGGELAWPYWGRIKRSSMKRIIYFQ